MVATFRPTLGSLVVGGTAQTRSKHLLFWPGPTVPRRPRENPSAFSRMDHDADVQNGPTSDGLADPNSRAIF